MSISSLHIVDERLPGDALLGKRVVALVLECSVRKVDYLVEDGELLAVKSGGSTKIPRSAVEAYIARLIAQAIEKREAGERWEEPATLRRGRDQFADEIEGRKTRREKATKSVKDRSCNPSKTQAEEQQRLEDLTK